MDDRIERHEQDLWVKIVEMLQQNWASVELTDSGPLVHFISDASEVFDEIPFADIPSAKAALTRNGFKRFSDSPQLQEFLSPPKPPFKRGRHPNGRIYSSGRYWHQGEMPDDEAAVTAGRQALPRNVAAARVEIKELRWKLLDLSLRNPLISFRHSDRARTHIRVIDELPDQLLGKLISGKGLTFKPLPEPEDEPQDEKSDRFRVALEQARRGDEVYRKAVEALDDDEDGSAAARRIERDLKDRVRKELEMMPRPQVELKSLRDYAKARGFEPAYDLPKPQRGDQRKRHTDNEIQTLMLREDMDRKLAGVLQTARSSLQEQGINTLFLAIGFLEWRDTKDTKRQLFAPLLLHAVEMTRELKGGLYRFSIVSIGDDTQLNSALSEKLKQDFRIELPAFSPEESVEAYLDRVEAAVLQVKPEWRLRRFVTLGHFAFSRLAMYRDLDPASWPKGQEPHRHPAVSVLLGGSDEDQGTWRKPYPLDEPDNVKRLPPLIYDADSSQASAVIDVIEGKDLAIEGPPGTGKSQTITNIIGAALAKGKRVLFVAEKMAALEVVKNRLDAAGLGAFVLELHSHKVRKREVLERFKERIDIETIPAPKELTEARESLTKEREKLNAYVAALLHSTVGKQGKTIQQLIWAAQANADLSDLFPHLKQLTLPNTETMLPQEAKDAREDLTLLGTYWDDFGRRYGGEREHPWFGVGLRQFIPNERDQILRHLEDWTRALSGVDALMLDVFGRSLSLSESRDFAFACKGLPAPPSNLLLFVQLRDRTSLQAVQQMAQDLEGRAEATLTMHDCCKDPSLLCREEQRLQELVPALGRLDLTSAKVRDLDELIREETKTAERLKALADYAVELMTAFGLQGRPQTDRLRPLLLACGLLRDLEDSTLALHAQALLSSDASSVIGDGVRRQADLMDRCRDLDRRFHVPLDKPGLASKLRLYARDLEGAGLFSFLSGEVNEAKRTYKRLSKQAKPPKPRVMAQDFDQIARLLDAVQGFAHDEKIRLVCGQGFKGIHTDFDGYLELLDFFDQVEIDLPGEGDEASAARALMLHGDLRTLRKVRRLIADDRFGRLSDLVDHFPADATDDLYDMVSRFRASVDRAKTLAEAAGLLQLREDCDLSRLEELGRAVAQYRVLGAAIEENKAALDTLEAAGLRHDADQVPGHEMLQEACTAAQAVHDLGLPAAALESLFSQDFDRQRAKFVALATELEEGFALAEAACAGFEGAARVDRQLFFDGDLKEMPIAHMRDRIERALADPGGLQSWTAFLSVSDRLDAAGLSAFVAGFRGEQTASANLARAFDFCLYNSLLSAAYKSHPELGQFRGLEIEQARKRFRKLDRDLLGLERQALIADLSARPVTRGINAGKASERTELSLIRSECQKQKKHIPLRDLLERAGCAAQELKPCFMMSPLSVAQFLKPGVLEFDLLLIDEASQMKPEEAIGALARAKQVVVVGDPKQLPPSAFFDRLTDDLDDEEEEEEEETQAAQVESILNLAMRAWHPYRRLLWHYRSRHESLIAISNKEFYEEQLIVFPAAANHSDELGISMEFIESRYRSGGTNDGEARRIAEAAIAFMTEEMERSSRHKTNPRSLGLVAMNKRQSDLIEDEVNLLLQHNEAAYRFIEHWQDADAGIESFFVKNLENVQGDERDVIYISTTYGPDHQSGKVHQRFGPINSPVGWRRLNVLFTRAKRKIRLFTSLRPGDVRVDDSPTSLGRQALRRYLAFAETGRLEAGKPTGGEPESDFERVVRSRLQERGFQVDCQVGEAGFRIDLGVKHPAYSYGYLAGVECDGATYHSAASARDRDRLRQEILEGLGWNIYRIWSTDWFNDPEGETDKLERWLRELLEEKQKAIEQAPPRDDRLLTDQQELDLS